MRMLEKRANGNKSGIRSAQSLLPRSRVKADDRGRLWAILGPKMMKYATGISLYATAAAAAVAASRLQISDVVAIHRPTDASNHADRQTDIQDNKQQPSPIYTPTVRPLMTIRF